MVPNNLLPTGDLPEHPWAHRYVRPSIGVLGLGLCMIGIGAWLDLLWVGATGIVAACLGLVGLVHVQLAWAQNVRESFSSARPMNDQAARQRDFEESQSARRPNDR